MTKEIIKLFDILPIRLIHQHYKVVKIQKLLTDFHTQLQWRSAVRLRGHKQIVKSLFNFIFT